MNKQFLGNTGMKIVFRSIPFGVSKDAVKIESYINGVLICAEDDVECGEAERRMQTLRDVGMLGYDRHETLSEGHIVRVWAVPEDLKPEVPPAGGYTPGPRQAKAEMPLVVSGAGGMGFWSVTQSERDAAKAQIMKLMEKL